MHDPQTQSRLRKSTADRLVVRSLAAAAAVSIVLAIGAVGIASLKHAAQHEAIRQAREAGQGIQGTLDKVDLNGT